jgi:hypothetical protein
MAKDRLGATADPWTEAAFVNDDVDGHPAVNKQFLDAVVDVLQSTTEPFDADTVSAYGIGTTGNLKADNAAIDGATKNQIFSDNGGPSHAPFYGITSGGIITLAYDATYIMQIAGPQAIATLGATSGLVYRSTATAASLPRLGRLLVRR